MSAVGRLVVLIASAALVAVAIFLGGAQDGTPPVAAQPGATTTTTTPDGPQPALLVEGEEAVIERAARELMGADYAGMWRADDGSLNVATAGSPVAVDGAVVHQVARPLTELEEYKDALDAASDDLILEDGVRLSWWSVDPAANAVRVEVLNDEHARGDSDPLALIEARLGPGPVELVPVAQGGTPMSRTADPNPHIGAAKIYNAYATCTSGVAWLQDPDVYTFLVSGHCADIYWLWLTTSGAYGVTGTTWNGLDQPNTGRIDVAQMLPVTDLQPRFYRGSPTSNTSVNPCCGDITWQAGYTGIRTSGAISGEWIQDTGDVIFTNGTMAFWDGAIFVNTVYHLNRAECGTSPGDSGAPVFRESGGGETILGILAASSGVDGECIYTPLKPIITSIGGAPAV